MSKNQTDIINAEYTETEVSPYDASYPIRLLSNGLKRSLEQAEMSAQDIYKAVIKEAPILAQQQESMKKGFRLVVDASEDTLKAIESGKIKLTTNKAGKMFAQIRQPNGNYGSKLSIKKEYFRKGLSQTQMANALQMKSLQNQVEVIEEQLGTINNNVIDVLQGQQNDRIGLYYSGVSLYIESKNVSDEEMKKQLLAQSLRALSESTFQISLKMQSDIQYLRDEKFKESKTKKAQLIDERMQSINQSFAFIYQSSMLRAGIYCEQKELGAMSIVLNEYSNFIENNVSKNSELLIGYDKKDTGTDSGIWKKRASFKLETQDFAKKLSMPNKVVYIGKEDD